MNILFETAIFNRKVLKNFLEELSYDQLVKIPKGFNNSIFWNIAHVLVTQQLLVYKNSGLKMDLDKEIIKKYTKGSKPSSDIPKIEIEYVKKNLMPTVLKLQEDYEKQLFKQYDVYHTSVKISLNNVDEALIFSAFHEGIHLGVILSLRKLV